MLVAGLLALAARLALGLPDGRGAVDFMSSERPTYSDTLAALGIVVWAIVGAVVVVQLALAIARARGVTERVQDHRVRAGTALLLGLLIFAGGALRHQATARPLCCGDMARAQRLLR
ncbi:MAG: hypothetical protein NVS3B24_04830 [Candidatus Dormibacteria bacterium]